MYLGGGGEGLWAEFSARWQNSQNAGAGVHEQRARG